ncbi:MAG: DpnI domain-containing protein [Candidatus Zixiibacteriota bacterium]
MNLQLPTEVAVGYRSESQRARILTEAWAEENQYCVACDSSRVKQTPPNTEAIDFVCPDCGSNYQLKATKSKIQSRIADAAYDAMMRAIRQDRFPHLLALQYNLESAQVINLLLIPCFTLSPSAIRARKPLSSTARRAGWVGCDILLNQVPMNGRIALISNSTIISPSEVRGRFQEAKSLETLPTQKRGWTLDVLVGLQRINRQEFTLNEAYSLETSLARLHPENRHIRDKIRQQLQVLRDLGYLKFLGQGTYKWTK